MSKAIIKKDFKEELRQGMIINMGDSSTDAFSEQPVHYKEFIESKEYLGLDPFSQRQYTVFEFLFGDNPRTAFENKNILFCGFWGKGSFSKDTELTDAKTGEVHTMSMWAKLKKQIHVVCFNFNKNKKQITKIAPPFLEGRGKMYKVKTKSGKTLYVNEHHKFFVRDNKEWKKIKDIKVGEKIATDGK